MITKVETHRVYFSQSVKLYKKKPKQYVLNKAQFNAVEHIMSLMSSMLCIINRFFIISPKCHHYHQKVTVNDMQKTFKVGDKL